MFSEPDRAEYGDFQTNTDLANNVTLHLTTKSALPEIVIEPTCGKGNFIVSSLKHFDSVKKVFGIEIYKPYVWKVNSISLITILIIQPKTNQKFSSFTIVF